MGMTRSRVMSAVQTLLKLLIVLNLVASALFLLVLAISFTEAFQAAVREGGVATPRKMIVVMRLVLTIGLLSVPFAHVLLTRLKAIVETVRAGDPFVAINAKRLKTIAWCLLALQLLDLGFGLASLLVEAPLAWSFALTGWLAVILLFVLARVFEHGARMRDDLAGTV